MQEIPYSITRPDTPVKGREVILFIVPPNLDGEIKVKYSIGSSIVKSLSGIEYRNARHLAMRLSMGWSNILTFESLWAFHETFINKGGRKFVVPLYCDVWKRDDFHANKHHATDVIIGWNDNYEDAVVVDDGSLPERKYVCNGMMGLFEKPKADKFNSDTAQVSWSFIEDSPFSAKITANANPQHSWRFPTNWRKQQTATFRDHLTYERIGSDREQSVDGFDEVKVEYSQELTLQDKSIAEFLSFFETQQGAVKPWRKEGEDIPLPKSEVTAPDPNGSDVGVEEGVTLWSDVDFESEIVGNYKKLEDVDGVSIDNAVTFESEIVGTYRELDNVDGIALENTVIFESEIVT